MKAPVRDDVSTSGDRIKILQLMKWLSRAEDTGGKIRCFRIGKALAAFADVDAAGFVVPGDEPSGREEHLSSYHRLYPFPALQEARQLPQILTSFAGGLSLRTARFLPGGFRAFMKNIIRNNGYDAIHVEELPLMASLDIPSLHIPVIFSSHNVESELSFRMFRRRNIFIKLLAGVEYRRTAQEERNAVMRAGATLAVSQRDKDSLMRLVHQNASSIHVLPNCAHDRFQPSLRKEPGKGLLTVGSFGWYPNREGLLWFVDKVLPLLRKKFPEEIIRVAGSEIDASLRRMLENKGIQVFSDVPDMLPFLQEARLLFVPLRIGGGTRIKILEAWAAGLPVVSTSIGAEGLPYRHGVNMLVADDVMRFAGEICTLLEDDGLCTRLRSEGLDASRNLRWANMNCLLQDVYRNVLKNRRACHP